MPTIDLIDEAGITTVDEALQFADITKEHFGDRPRLMADDAVVVLAAEVRRLTEEAADLRSQLDMWDR